MTIATGNASVLIVDTQLRTLRSADLSTAIYGLAFRIEVAARADSAATLYVPATAGVRHNMVCLRSFGHQFEPRLFIKIYYLFATPNS